MYLFIAITDFHTNKWATINGHMFHVFQKTTKTKSMGFVKIKKLQNTLLLCNLVEKIKNIFIV